MMMLFSERKKLAEQYEKWISENKDVLDCPLTVISWLVGEGYVVKTKVADLEAKLAKSEEQRQQLKDWLDDEILTSVDHESYNATINEYEEQITELKQQLQEIKNAKAQELADYLHTSIPKCIVNEKVELLEKVKELLLENLYDLYSKPSEIWDKYGDLYDVVVEGGINKTIDNQIKQLKEGE